jgi:hypothetical protein
MVLGKAMLMKNLIVMIFIAFCASSSAAVASARGLADGHSGHMGHLDNYRHHHRHLFLAAPYWPDDQSQDDHSEDDQSGFEAYPQEAPRSDVAGSTTSQPCHWDAQIFNVPSSAGGTRPITVTSCR